MMTRLSRARRLLLAPLLTWLAACGEGDLPINPAPTPTGPAADVELAMDDLGITHVYAKSDADAFFGAGYAMARDRLFQAEMTRRQALGTRAEVLGPSFTRGDIAARAMNFAKLGAADYARTAKERPADAVLVDAWIQGVNRRIAEVARGEVPRPYGLGTEDLDFVPEPWKPEHPYAIGKLLAFGLSNTLDAELLATAILRLAPETATHLPLLLPAYDTFITVTSPPMAPPGGAPPPLPPATSSKLPSPFHYEPMFPQFASNNWAITAAHSDNGKPLLAGDPHQPTSSPQRLWPVHMSSVAGGGTLDVIGFSFVGTPTVELGHNARIGWTATTSFGDAMDLWDVPAGGSWTTVKLGGESRAVVTRNEVVKIKPDGGGALAEKSINIHEIPGFGVFLPGEILPLPLDVLADGALLFNWTGFGASIEASAYLAFDRARNVDDFLAAANLMEVGALNLVAADAHDVVHQVHARIPDRGDPSARPMPWHVVSGADAGSLWTKMKDLPADQLPHLRNPERGFVCTGNNDPFGFTADGSVENDPYYYGAFYATGFRPHRMEEVLVPLLAQRKLNRTDMESLQRDTHSPMADTLLPHLAEAMAATATDPALAAYLNRADLQSLAERLAAWDRRFDKTQAAPVIFSGLEWFAIRRMFGPRLPGLFPAIQQKSPAYFPGMLRNVLEGRFTDAPYFLPDGKSALLLGALDETAKWLTKRFGSIDAAFAMQDVHGAEFPAIYGAKLARPLARVNGSFDTINVSQAAFFDDSSNPRDSFVSEEVSLYRMVMAFGEDGTPEATFDFALGASGEPSSPHFDDLTPTWLDAAHVKLPFRRADVDARITERAVLKAGR